MRIISDATTVEACQKALIQNGHEANGVGSVSMRAHAYCDAPIATELAARIGASVIDRGRPNRPRYADLLLPCRRCKGCRSYRHSDFIRSATAEMACSTRTWLLAITMAPEVHARYGGLAVPLDEQRAAWTRSLQLYWKRVRKVSGAKLRIAWVLEHHKSGLLHAHALVHEQAGSRLRVSLLDSCWGNGSINTQCVTDRYERAARYVAKYLVKDHDAVCVASRLYGRTPCIAEMREREAGCLTPSSPPLSPKAYALEREALAIQQGF